jgi:hypothetical protein
MNKHKCPSCKRPCNCDDLMLSGECLHDCDGWKANPDALSRIGWDGVPYTPEPEE